MRQHTFNGPPEVAMSLVIRMNGREAMAVRALPWVSGRDGTRWHFDAVDVAQALACSAMEWVDFARLTALRADGTTVDRNFWMDVLQELQSLRAVCVGDHEWRL